MSNQDFQFFIPFPDLQIEFSARLLIARETILQQALLSTVSKLDISQLDLEVHEYVPPEALKTLAGCGLRAEIAFALPTVLHTNPHLLGYYRLLLGFSQKAFYTKKFGLSSAGFLNMEENGVIDSKISAWIPALCKAINQSSAALIEGMKPKNITNKHLDELTLLTFGTLLRGSHNVKIGTDAVSKVFNVIKEIVGKHSTKTTDNFIEVLDATGRQIGIRFSSDPDIDIFTIGQASQSNRPLLAIEVKGGKDLSNAHNRLGEAEKSHLKAKAKGYTELWTIVNVEGLSDEDRKAESPTTNAFFDLSDLTGREGSAYDDFRDRLLQKLRLPED
jgi:hypothetical protein